MESKKLDKVKDNSFDRQKTEAQVKALGQMYNLPIKIFEITSVVVYVVLLFISLWKIRTLPLESPLIFLLGFVGGWIVADFTTGLLHWFFDTWGRLSWPIFGKLFVRDFLIHHISPRDITKHGWLETNGSNIFVAALILAGGLYFNASLGLLGFLIFLTFWGAPSNQFHKWAHQSDSELPKFATFLQKIGVIISKDAHAKHHSGEFTYHYCITNGFMNPILDKIGFFRVLEKVISTITRVKPRDNEFPLDERETI